MSAQDGGEERPRGHDAALLRASFSAAREGQQCKAQGLHTVRLFQGSSRPMSVGFGAERQTTLAAGTGFGDPGAQAAGGG